MPLGSDAIYKHLTNYHDLREHGEIIELVTLTNYKFKQLISIILLITYFNVGFQIEMNRRGVRNGDRVEKRMVKTECARVGKKKKSDSNRQ